MAKREKIMSALYITVDEMMGDKALVIEKCFCAALLNQDSRVVGKVLDDYLELRNTLYPHMLKKGVGK
jgi:hypothetical protein